MASVNKAILMGNVGKDIDVKETKSGKRIGIFSVATSEGYKKDGQWVNITEWHNVTVLNDGLVGVLDGKVMKGSQVYVEGAIKSEKYTDKNGVERTSTKIVVGAFDGTVKVLSKSDAAEADQPEQTAHNKAKSDGYAPVQTKYDDFEDSIPF